LRWYALIGVGYSILGTIILGTIISGLFLDNPLFGLGIGILLAVYLILARVVVSLLFCEFFEDSRLSW
jgi:hypothetical protein